MRIWIDLANSPHPVLFEPIARELEDAGHELLITVRDQAQTRALAERHLPGAVQVGGASPLPLAAKAGAILDRARRLAAFARRAGPDIAVSHNSYAQAIAARATGVRCVTAMDYEHQPANHVAFRLASRVLVPEAFPEAALRRQGARRGKVWRYRGFKEEVYLHGFRPDPAVLDDLGLGADDRFVVARPSPHGATYHRRSNVGFEAGLRALLESRVAKVVLLPRRPEDGAPFSGQQGLIVPPRPLDARSLVAFAGTLVGAGGTMNREAALLGTPVVSAYEGRLGALDARLIEEGMLRPLGSGPGELPRVVAELAQRPTRRRPIGRQVLDRFLEAILAP